MVVMSIISCSMLWYTCFFVYICMVILLANSEIIIDTNTTTPITTISSSSGTIESQVQYDLIIDSMDNVTTTIELVNIDFDSNLNVSKINMNVTMVNDVGGGGGGERQSTGDTITPALVSTDINVKLVNKTMMMVASEDNDNYNLLPVDQKVNQKSLCVEASKRLENISNGDDAPMSSLEFTLFNTESPQPLGGIDNNKVTEKSKNISETKTNWTYWGPNGEHHWDKSFKSCRGRSQSPINIDTSRIFYLSDLQISFINYDQPLNQLRMINNGRTVRLEPSPLTNSEVHCFVTGNVFPDSQTYRFLQLHFHWRNADYSGSEHAINGEKFSMEMHIVHQNIRYDTEKTDFVLRQRDAFTVLAVFFNETTTHNDALDPLIEQFAHIANMNDQVLLQTSIRLDSLLPKELDKFYRYAGSYTTPGCQEVVTWILFPFALPIDSLQMHQFRELIFNLTHHNDGGSVSNNIGADTGNSDSKAKLQNVQNEENIGFFRHIQEVGTRHIYAPYNMKADSGSATVLPCIATLAHSFCLCVLWGVFFSFDMKLCYAL